MAKLKLGIDLHNRASVFMPEQGLDYDLNRLIDLAVLCEELGFYSVSVGDSLLQLVSERLCSVLREIDTVARHGGDEFIVLLPKLPSDSDAAAVADKLLALFRRPFVCAGHEFFVSASIGISLFPRDAEDVDSLIKHADAAMYRAKSQGRNRYAFYTSDLTVTAQHRMEMENYMRRGLERNEFILHYQPKQDLASGNLNGVEALVRWQHPQRGLVDPDQFIPLAEETGLIVDLGRRIIDLACAQIADWRHAGLALPRVAINVSGVQLIGTQLVTDLRRALSEHDIPASLLELEITEDFVMNQNREAIHLLELFRDMNIQLAIDDFGTGLPQGAAAGHPEDRPQLRLRPARQPSRCGDQPDHYRAGS